MSRRTRRTPWRLATGLAGALAGLLMVTSAVTSAGVGLRADDLGNLPDLAGSMTRHYRALDRQRHDLLREVGWLSTATLAGSAKLTARVSAAEQEAGLTPLAGAGIRVTLDDAPSEQITSAADLGLAPADLLVHQQDIQAVVNALWAAGARGVTVQGQRVIATTGIKCVGNTVILQGVPYAPPYVIEGIGDPMALETSVYTDPYVRLYLQLVPKGLRFEERQEPSIHMPAYTGSVELHYARPARPAPP